MRLKKLELIGFKSFAKPTILEFPAAISAIVGPNGSGKSNIVEGIRWALGEQAFKNLRGKKSEDFIFNGSAMAPKMGKASVALFFDPVRGREGSQRASASNGIDPEKKGEGFEEIIITRKVYRDGANEYFINNSHVRLKDVMELLSGFGLGASSHHIISQGEADRVLSASSKERREMLEDALGLKIFQLKRQEAERKLKRTRENINQVESLRKEIQPHLKFLKKQAEKAERASDLRKKLKELCLEYFSKEKSSQEKEESRLLAGRGEPLKELSLLEEKIKKLKDESLKETKIAVPPEMGKIEKELEEIRMRRVSLERETGKIEGMIELEELRQKEASRESVEKSKVESFLEKINQLLEEEFSKRVFEKIKEAISEFSAEIKIRRQNAILSEIENLKNKRADFSRELGKISAAEKEQVEKLRMIKSDIERRERSKIESERELYAAEIKAGNLRNFLKSFEIDEEKLKVHKEEMEAEKKSAEHFLGEDIMPKGGALWDSGKKEEARREIERIKIKLEDSEGIGDDVLKEFNQVRARDEFFEKELGDLEKAAVSLIDLMKELAEKIDHDFQKGVEEINKEFRNFFTIMFGGGEASLKIIKVEKRKLETPTLDEVEVGVPTPEDVGSETEEGIEISVNIPRKRIHSLEMLSGGERALTSIALLFAMTQVNPPPFLVLDETDAALDESNSQKYGKMLKDLSKKTQLIIITHNRETMKQASLLYGVTLGSSGISQILSIKFDEAEELAAQDKT